MHAFNAAKERGFPNPDNVHVHASWYNSGPSYSVMLWDSKNKEIIRSQICNNPVSAIQSIKDEIEHYQLTYSQSKDDIEIT